jgi:DNA primase large subunit
LAIENMGVVSMETIPKIVKSQFFPPCIKTLYKAALSGHHLSHIGRFTLTAFLLNIGMPPHELIALLKNMSDFNNKMTEYQVSHIAGETGSRIKYLPPKCVTLKTHGVCTSPDKNCETILHPLTYYKRILK